MSQPEPLTEQQLDELTAIAARAADDPFYVSDCEGSLQVWREKALTHVRRDGSGVIDMYSFPSTYKVTDQIVELDLSTWDPGEDATDDQQRQDINDLVEARAALPALVAKIERLEGQRKYLLGQLARKDAASGEGDRALREFLGGEPETDTLPAWLRQRFTASATPWEHLDDGEQSYWEHQARAVRRAVARGGFKTASEATSAPLAASQPPEAPEGPGTATRPPTGRTGDPRRTLTPNEYDAAWRAVGGAAGEEGADPGTVLHAVLDRLGIDWQDAARTV